MACARRSPRWDSGSRSTSPRYRAVPRCSTGSCRTSGTSATPTSRHPRENASSTSRRRTSTSSATASRSSGTFTLDELRPHLHTHSAEPGWIPYRTSYYDRTWGFCVSQRQLERDGRTRVRRRHRQHARTGLTHVRRVRAPGRDGGRGARLTTHVCHPSLANDNVSGMVLLTELAAALAARPRRLTYRLLFIPGTIGSITWLARNEDAVARVAAGLVLACVGDPAPLTYKRSRRGAALVDTSRRARRRARRRRPGQRLRPVGMGRASVQLARASTCRSGCSHAVARGRVPRVPLVGGRPRAHRSHRAARGRARRGARRSSTSSRTTGHT